MTRNRIKKPQLIRSTDGALNSQIVRKSKKRIKRIERTKTVERFIHNAFGTKGRFIYNGLS